MAKTKFQKDQQVKPNTKAPKFAQQRYAKGGTCKIDKILGNGYYTVLWNDGYSFKQQGSHYETVTQVSKEQFNETLGTLKKYEHPLIGKTVQIRDLDGVYLNHDELLEQFDFPAFDKGNLPVLGDLGVVVELQYDGEEDVAAIMIGEKGYLVSADCLKTLTDEEVKRTIAFSNHPKLDKVVQDFIDEQHQKIEKLQEKISPELAEMSDRTIISIIAQQLNKVPSPKVYKLMNHLISLNPDLGNNSLAELYKKSEEILENTLK